MSPSTRSGMAKDHLAPQHLNNLGLLQREMGELDEADKLTQQALALGIETYGPNDPQRGHPSRTLEPRRGVLRAMTVRNLQRALRGRPSPRLERSPLPPRRPGRTWERALATGEEVSRQRRLRGRHPLQQPRRLLLDLEDYDGAKRYLDQAVTIARRDPRPDPTRAQALEINRDTAAQQAEASPAALDARPMGPTRLRRAAAPRSPSRRGLGCPPR